MNLTLFQGHNGMKHLRNWKLYFLDNSFPIKLKLCMVKEIDTVMYVMFLFDVFWLDKNLNVDVLDSV